jgi:thiamine biosynthesis lipoprotein
MGTNWHVTAGIASQLNSEQINSEQLTALVQQALDQVNDAMSTYKPRSDLGRFNRAAVGQWVAISLQTLEVTRIALQVAEQSDNAFNPAVAALVDLWGFGPSDSKGQGAPTAKQIEAAMAASQLQHLEIDESVPALRKRSAISLDYSAIAKGYGVDQVAEQLERAGIDNYMVEVGGEVRTNGKHPEGRPWRIGIERPQLRQGQAVLAIALGDEAVATSGDYCNYRELDGRRYSHTIDPATGHPVRHRLASVTVLARTAVLADAYATAITVMGPERGLAFAESMALPVYLLVKQGDGFEARHSSAFKRYLH